MKKNKIIKYLIKKKPKWQYNGKNNEMLKISLIRTIQVCLGVFIFWNPRLWELINWSVHLLLYLADDKMEWRRQNFNR